MERQRPTVLVDKATQTPTQLRTSTFRFKSDSGCHPQTEERSGGSLWVGSIPRQAKRLRNKQAPTAQTVGPTALHMRSLPTVALVL